MAELPGRLSRYSQITRLLLKYRHSNIFSGMLLDEQVPAEAAALPPVQRGEPEQFATDLEALGPTFVKIGQALSTRPDMVQPAYADALERMQDHVAPFDSAAVRAMIESELGNGIWEAFDEFEDQPLAAASLAQVHAARLRSGRDVVVKVQRPSAIQLIATDLDILHQLASGAERISALGRKLGLRDWVTQVRETMLCELDYRQEAENLRVLRGYAEPYPDLHVPEPIENLSGVRVLTMERVHGRKITDLVRARPLDRSLQPHARSLLSLYLDQVFMYGFVHVDPHPGNILLTDDGRLAIIDLGMVTYIAPRLRDQLFQLLLAAMDGRGDDVAEIFMAVSLLLDQCNANGFERQATRLVARYAATSGQTLSEGRLVLELTRHAAMHGIRPPPALTLLGKTLLNLEAVCLALISRRDVVKSVEEYLQRSMRHRLMNASSAANTSSTAIDLFTLAGELPRMTLRALRTIANNRLQLHIAGLEKAHLIESMQKIANRITAGIVAAALVLGGALTIRLSAGPTLAGYPVVAVIQFALAAAIALALLLSSSRDRRSRDNSASD